MKVSRRTKQTLAIGGAVGALVLVAVLNTGQPAKKQVAQPQPQKSLLVLVNEERSKAGKPPVVEDQQLDAFAQAKVGDQVARNYWAHHLDGEDTYQFFTPQYHRLNRDENLVRCSVTNSQAVESWHNSPIHYAGMIGDYTRFGWAQKVNPKDRGCLYIVTYFVKL